VDVVCSFVHRDERRRCGGRRKEKVAAARGRSRRARVSAALGKRI
jgi:hypothetical protein